MLCPKIKPLNWVFTRITVYLNLVLELQDLNKIMLGLGLILDYLDTPLTLLFTTIGITVNERIKLLALESDLFHILPNGNLYPTAMTAEQSIAAYQKFAQLIAEECADIAREVGTNTVPEDFALDKCYEIEDKIKQHFGVEL